MSSQKLDALDFTIQCLKDTIDDLDQKISRIEESFDKYETLLALLTELSRAELERRFQR